MPHDIVIMMPKTEAPRQSLPTGPSSTWTQGGKCFAFEPRMRKMTAAIMKGIQQIKLKVMWTPTLRNLNPRIPVRQSAGKNIGQADTIAKTSSNTNPRTNQWYMFTAVTFVKVCFRDWTSSTLSWKILSTSAGIMLEKLRGKLRHGNLPTQYSFVPIEQFLGISASIALGISVMPVPTAVWTWLIALGITVATPLIALPAPLWRDWIISRSWEVRLTAAGWSRLVKLNCGGVTSCW